MSVSVYIYSTLDANGHSLPPLFILSISRFPHNTPTKMTFLVSFLFLTLCLASLILAKETKPSCPSGQVIIGKSCGKCPPGRVYESIGHYCFGCNRNYFKPFAGQGDCLACPPGTSSLGDASRCIKCPLGQALLSNGRCGTCPPGTYFNTESECIKCRTNTFQPFSHVRYYCLTCPGDSYAPEGSSKCIKCPSNKVVKDGACISCPPGTFTNKYLTGCKLCGRDAFQPNTNARSSCFKCAGKTNKPTGATKCTKCLPGERFYKDGSCRTCPPNKALMKDGTCASCPPGTHYTKFKKKCSKCRLNTFQPERNVRASCFICSGDSASLPGASKCTKCPADKVFMQDGTCSKCPDGTEYEYDTMRCNTCEPNSYSVGKGIDQTCAFCPTSYFATEGSTRCFRCPKGQVLLIREGAKKGKCGRCGPGYYLQSDYPHLAICTHCSKTYGQRFASPGGLIPRCNRCRTGTEPNSDNSACV